MSVAHGAAADARLLSYRYMVARSNGVPRGLTIVALDERAKDC